MIPDKAIDAGTEAYLKTIRDFQEQFGDDDMPHPEHCIRAALEAAVPYLTADATPDDEAAWEAWAESTPLTYDPEGPVHLGFVAGRVSGRADAAAQALEDAADELQRPGERTAKAPPHVWEWLRARAAQYREKGKAQ